MQIKGKAWKLGKNIDTDLIIAGRYCNLTDPKALAEHVLEDLDPKFSQNVRTGDIIIADSNFGCGSSREVAPLAIKALGISAIIAVSFARIFYRNALNIGLPIFECAEAYRGIDGGVLVEVNPDTGMIIDHDNNIEYKANPFPPFMQKIIAAGGLIGYAEYRLEEKNLNR